MRSGQGARAVVDERGATLVTVAGGLILLLGFAAAVLDLGALRSARQAARLTVDSAAAAGAAELAEGSGQDACNAAVAYAEINLDTDFDIDCGSFPATTCNPATAVSTISGTTTPWTLTIRYPVDAGDSLMDPAAIGASSQAVTVGDGDRCERFGVLLSRSHRYVFGRIFGESEGSATVHAVARGGIPTLSDVPFDVVVLERYERCALGKSGDPSGGIEADVVFNPGTGLLERGQVTVDSDGSLPDSTGMCASTAGVIDLEGDFAEIRADGPECPDQTGGHIGPGGLAVGEGCGSIRVYAHEGAPTCSYPECTGVPPGDLAPLPGAQQERVTRAPIDHRYNCKATYAMPAGWGIVGCPDTSSPAIDGLVSAYGSGVPAGFTLWSATPAGVAEGCNIVGGVETRRVYVTGDILIDCPGGMSIERTLIHSGGDIIFTGPVDVTSQYGVLAVNTNGAEPDGAGPENAVAYFRNGSVAKSAAASIYLHKTMGYFSATTTLILHGGLSSTSALVWVAPVGGEFDDLAMWSESPDTHVLEGQANLDVEGLLFAPWATIRYVGYADVEQIDAQIVARRFHVAGHGLLVLHPGFDRAVRFPQSVGVELLR